ncbi:MAG: penicillin-binding protein 2 [Rhodospirillales bacterium]|nr:penicillin-binding protein 2 [Rhodospirillales bacterium]
MSQPPQGPFPPNSPQDRPPPPPDAAPPMRSRARPAPAPRQGAARADAVPLMETVRVTAPDLRRRAALEKTRERLFITACFFVVLFVAVIGKLADATIIDPLHPRPPSHQIAAMLNTPTLAAAPPLARRAMITDRNGQILAISLPTVSVYADPRQMMDPNDAARKLKQVLPDLDEAALARRLSDAQRQFVYVARQVTPDQERRILDLGIPGIDFRPTEDRHYPMGRTAAQVLGAVDVDEDGIAGVEKHFNKRLFEDPTPLRLSIDVRVQAVLREELDAAYTEFTAKSACGVVMDIDTGEVLALVSLPDYDANNFATAPANARFDCAASGMYEPGSTFKLQTLSMALQLGVVHVWNEFDAAHPIHVGRFTITDFEGENRWLYLPEVLAYSSNLGAAHIALDVGPERQQAWLRMMGMFKPVPIQLPEADRPIVPPISRWKALTTMTVGFGNGIAVSPLHIVRGTAAVANGGVLVTPTLLAQPPSNGVPEGERVMSEQTSDTMRKLMRLVVTQGTAKGANIPGFYVGGKTGTSQVVGKGGYRQHTNISTFVGVFPMNAPRYVVYFMLNEPHGNKSTGGFSTAGAVSVPGGGRVIARIGPMLGVLPDLTDQATIDQALYMPMQPPRPPGQPITPPDAPIPGDHGFNTAARAAYRRIPGHAPLPPAARPVASHHPARGTAPHRPVPPRAPVHLLPPAQPLPPAARRQTAAYTAQPRDVLAEATQAAPLPARASLGPPPLAPR